jgi:hypothetical protein
MLGHVYEKVKTDKYDDEDMMEDEEEAESTWARTNTTIDEFILWKKDLAPNQRDPRANTIKNWIEISKAVSVPFVSLILPFSNTSA